MAARIEEKAYSKMLMHLLKYHKSDVIGTFSSSLFFVGVLIGEKKNGELHVKDAIPLFHQRVMTGPLEIAFDMIEASYPVSE